MHEYVCEARVFGREFFFYRGLCEGSLGNMAPLLILETATLPASGQKLRSHRRKLELQKVLDLSLGQGHFIVEVPVLLKGKGSGT